MQIPDIRTELAKHGVSAAGSISGFWAVSVFSNWRVTFRFDNTHAADVDYIDYR
jgi:plasmid maintenance system killer protein